MHSKTCPYCGTSYNGEANHCGDPPCRQKEYRKNLRLRLDTARAATRARVATYTARLNTKQYSALQWMADVLMAEESADREKGHTQVEAVLDLLDELSCKHHKISYLTNYAELLLRRAIEAETRAKEQAALDKKRIEELEQEILLYQQMERHIHGLAEQQLALQPDQEPSKTPDPLKAAANIR